MKKQLLAIAILATSYANAQVWSENFSSTPTQTIPASWLQNNVDGLTVTSSLASYSFGTNAWITRDWTSFDPAHGKIVVSTSWYTPAGVANDWLITPSFTVPANSVLEWDALVTDASFADGYQVKISTTGTTVASFTTNLFTIGAENDTWTTRGLSLNTYSNQTVRLAFVNNSNDKDRLALDNITVKVPQMNDGNLVSITGLNRYIVGAGNQTIAGVLKSVGYSTANSAVLNYKINNGSVMSQTFTLPGLSYGQTFNYSFTTPGAFALGSNNVKVWVSSVNGASEVVTTNDTAKTVVYVASVGKPRNALVEEFSSSTCNPCASLNSTFDPLLNSNNPNTGGQVNVIKYQVNWPNPGNDPSYNAHGRNRVDHYGINAAPSALTNGRTDMTAHNQAEINAAKAEVAFADATASLTMVGNVLTASSSFTPYVSIPTNSPLRMHQVILQQFYNYPGAVTSQKNYYHIMRKMDPNGWGLPTTVTDGVALGASFTHTVNTVTTPAQNSYNFWTSTTTIYEYVAFIQDSVSNHILNSTSAQYTVTGVGVVKYEENKEIGVYPNPCSDFAVVGVKLDKSSTLDISIFDITGKLVYVNKGSQVEAGSNEIKINTSEFKSGTYTIIVNTGNGTLKEKLIVIK
jgi:hypothetical protein